jgi:hypothetical protein
MTQRHKTAAPKWNRRKREVGEYRLLAVPDRSDVALLKTVHGKGPHAASFKG